MSSNVATQMMKKSQSINEIEGKSERTGTQVRTLNY